MQLRRRGEKWYVRGTFNGERFERCTGLTDKKAAEAWARQFERDLADPQGPARRAAQATTVQQAVDLTLARHDAEHREGNLAAQTVAYYERKLGQLLRVFGEETPLASVDASAVDRYIAQRREEKASQHTIAKELHQLEVTLKLAKRRGLYTADVEAVMPVQFSPKYEPKTRALSVAEVQLVLRSLDPDRAAWVALACGAGAELAALERAQRGDFDEKAGTVRVRGTKNARRDRVVPLALPVCRELVAFAFKHGGGAAPLLLAPWEKNWRDLQSAVARINKERDARTPAMEPFSLHTLRHTFATWHLAAGLSWDDVARACGHADTTMLHRIYGHMKPEELRARLASLLAPPVPRKAGQAGQKKQRVQRRSKDKTPSGEGVLGCRRTELNCRPWDYDSKGRAELKRLFSPGKRTRRALRKERAAPPVPHTRAKR